MIISKVEQFNLFNIITNVEISHQYSRKRKKRNEERKKKEEHFFNQILIVHYYGGNVSFD